MGLERRRHKSYYYLKVRRGGRVFSHYLGPQDQAAGLIAARDAGRQARAGQDALDAQLDRLARLVRTLVDVHLLLAGYHTHHRQWRKKR